MVSENDRRFDVIDPSPAIEITAAVISERNVFVAIYVSKRVNDLIRTQNSVVDTEFTQPSERQKSSIAWRKGEPDDQFGSPNFIFFNDFNRVALARPAVRKDALNLLVYVHVQIHIRRQTRSNLHHSIHEHHFVRHQQHLCVLLPGIEL